MTPVEGFVLAKIRLHIVKSIFLWFNTVRFLIPKSLNCRPKELKGERLVSGIKGRRSAFILPWSWLFCLEDTLGSVLNSVVNV